MNHVIIGAGPAGVIAAETLRKVDPAAGITVVGDEPEPPYSRMAIPYLLTGNVGEEGTHLRHGAGHFEALGVDVRRERDWILSLSEAEVAEFDAALEHFRSLAIEIQNLDRASFPLPTLSAKARAWRREIMSGRGFVLLRGFPVDRWGEEGARIVFWGLGHYLGIPGAQNARGDLLGEVSRL